MAPDGVWRETRNTTSYQEFLQAYAVIHASSIESQPRNRPQTAPLTTRGSGDDILGEGQAAGGQIPPVEVRHDDGKAWKGENQISRAGICSLPALFIE